MTLLGPGPGADDDFDFLTPVETFGQGDPDAPRRNRWLMVVGAVALVGVTAWAVTSGSAKDARPAPDPTPSAVEQSTTSSKETPVQALPLTDEGRPYLRVDGTAGRAVVVVPLTNTDVAPVTLTGVDVSGGAPGVSAELMTMAQASPLIVSASGPAVLSDPSAPRPAPAPIGLEQGVSAALVLIVSPDCGADTSGADAIVTVHGTTTIAGSAAPADFLWLPVTDPSNPSPTWLTDAYAALCHPVASPPATTTSVSHVVDGMRMTTAGPTRLPSGTMFVVTLTATNTTRTTFRGALGVMAATRVAGDGFPSFVTPDRIDTRADLIGAGIVGAQVKPLTAFSTGAELRHQSLAAGATMTCSFYLDATDAPEIVGPVRGWVPVVQRDGTSAAAMPDAGGYPVLTLPR